jgi:hypothetical protein
MMVYILSVLLQKFERPRFHNTILNAFLSFVKCIGLIALSGVWWGNLLTGEEMEL